MNTEFHYAFELISLLRRIAGATFCSKRRRSSGAPNRCSSRCWARRLGVCSLVFTVRARRFAGPAWKSHWNRRSMQMNYVRDGLCEARRPQVRQDCEPNQHFDTPRVLDGASWRSGAFRQEAQPSDPWFSGNGRTVHLERVGSNASYRRAHIHPGGLTSAIAADGGRCNYCPPELKRALVNPRLTISYEISAHLTCLLRSQSAR